MPVLKLYGIAIFAIVVGGPAVLMALLLYYGSRSRREEQRSTRRGFEVKQPAGGESPVLREKENDHG